MASPGAFDSSDSDTGDRPDGRTSVRFFRIATAVLLITATVLMSVVGLQYRDCRDLRPELVRLHMAIDGFEHACVNLVYAAFSDENARQYRETLTVLSGRVEGNEWPEPFVAMHRDIVSRMERLWPEIENLLAGEFLSEGLVLISEYYGDAGSEKPYEVVGELIDFTINDYFDYSDAMFEVRGGLLRRQQNMSKLMNLGIFVYLLAIVLFFFQRGMLLLFRARRTSKEMEILADDRRKRLEEAQELLLEREKSVTVGQMVAGVAHDVNSPLGICLTGVSYLESRVADAPGGKVDAGEFSDSLKLVRSNLERALDLIRGFKTVTADGVGDKPRSFDLVDYLEHDLIPSLRPTLRKRGHAVEFNGPDAIVMLENPGEIAQIVSNLVLNASNYAYEPGTPGTVVVSVLSRTDRVEISVADAGKGMDEETLARMYDPFFTTGRDKGGTGLGLAIVFNLVKIKLHGDIRCDSEPGKGTVFTVDLPIPTARTP